jgi:predicted nuclease with RNAse H fold
VWLGIDFSGDATRWGPAVRRSNVWIASLGDGPCRPRLQSIHPVQDLAGPGHPFSRLADHLRCAQFAAAAIDAPFSIPASCLGERTRDSLLEAVLRMDCAPRPFPRGDAFCAEVRRLAHWDEPKPHRRTEQLWRRRGINVRSTLWSGARGGAPFTAACLRLLAESGLPCWPWSPYRSAVLVEAFPAAQIWRWGRRPDGYAGSTADERRNREAIVCTLEPRIDLTSDQRALLVESADALDAVIAGFAARAVTTGRLAEPLPATHDDEGWIAVNE